MGYTIEDMLLFSKKPYKMELVGGAKGWSNSISWVFMLEDLNVVNHFVGKELAVTTGLGFDSTKKLEELIEVLVKKHAAGLIINVGEYISEIPREIMDICDKNDFPLLTVPWEIVVAEMMKDISTRVFFQGVADERIQNAFIHSIKDANSLEARQELLPYFDVDGDFQIALLTAEQLDVMDTVERKRLGYRMQLYLENISHNGCFFYYDGNFVLIMNNVGKEDMTNIIEGMLRRSKQRMSELPLYVGVGSCMKDLKNLSLCYKRAKAARNMAFGKKQDLIYYDDMGIYRLLFSVEDQALLQEMEESRIGVLKDYDEKHNANYVDTLEQYLKYNGSIQAISEAMFTHRNTIIYRINNIKKLIHCDLSTPEERTPYQIAFYIKNMRER